MSRRDENANHTLRRSALTLILTAAFAVPSPAQMQGPGQDKSVSQSQVERKNRAPVSKDVLAVKLPKAAEFTLDNGLTVLVLESHRLPTVNVTLNISASGGLFEPPDMPGIASITAQMLREGTKTRSSKQIAEEADQLGASINASSGFNSAATQFSASGLADNFDQWMELAIDVLMNPSFPQEELSKLRDRQKNQLRQQRTSPQFLASERYSRAVYGGHPAAVVATTAAALDAMTPAALAQWHARYSPQNAILGIVGDVHTAALMPKVRKWFGAWKKSDIKEELPPNPSPAKAFRIYIVDRPGSVQTTLWVGNIAIDRKDPDYIPFSVMNQIIGGGPAGRLFMNLRENKSYTYGYYSSFQALKYPGAWTAAGDVRTEVTEGAMTEVMREIRRIRDEKVPAEELDQRIRAIVASFALSLEQPGSLLNNEIVRKIYNLPKDYWDRYPAMVSAVSAEDVQRMAQKYLSPDALQVVAVGDAGKIKAWFEKFGPVEVWGSDGKPKAAAEGGK